MTLSQLRTVQVQQHTVDRFHRCNAIKELSAARAIYAIWYVSESRFQLKEIKRKYLYISRMSVGGGHRLLHDDKDYAMILEY